MEKLKRFEAAVQTMSANEREAMRKAMRKAADNRDWEMLELITGIGIAHTRTIQRQDSDRRTDARRRRLIGVRIPLEDYERCRASASRQGVSLYRFAVDALECACREKVPPEAAD